MAASNTTLTSLWVDDGAGSPLKNLVTTPTKMSTNGSELKDDIMKFYQETGLEPVAKEAGIIDANGDLTGFSIKDQNTQPRGAVQMIAVPISGSPAKSPFKMENVQPHILPRTVSSSLTASPMILGTPQRMVNTAHVVTQSPHTPQLVATPIQIESPGWSAIKRTHEFLDGDAFDAKRGKKGEKGGKGLRHFSMKVCEKVQKKGVTSYNEVADELVAEFSDPRNISPTDQAYDQKNIRRRVYDALNVLMAMNIISKEKKEIRWIGLPTNSAQECQNLELEKQRREDRIRHKTTQLQELILQQIAFKNLVQRNRQLEGTQGSPASNSAIQLPFIIVNTSKKTVIDCSISNDKYEYLFNFDNTFEIHDDIEVLKRMGMAFGLEKGQCSATDLQKSVKMVPKSLEPYVLELAKVKTTSITAGPSGIQSGSSSGTGQRGPVASASQSPLATPLTIPGMMAHDPSVDSEVAQVNAGQVPGLSRQSSIGSYSDMAPSRETPSEAYSGESESERSSPVELG